jgi:hypothetical protein
MHSDASRKRHLVAFSWSVFATAPKPTQTDIDFVVERTRDRILRYLEKRGVITSAAAPAHKRKPLLMLSDAGAHTERG